MTLSTLILGMPPEREEEERREAENKCIAKLFSPSTRLHKLRVEFSVHCTFHIARRPVIALMPHLSWRDHDRASIDRAIDRTESRLKVFLFIFLCSSFFYFVYVFYYYFPVVFNVSL
jgi:hypothetical protein